MALRALRLLRASHTKRGFSGAAQASATRAEPEKSPTKPFSAIPFPDGMVPLLGHGLDLFKAGDRVHEVFQQYAERYPNNPVLRLKMGFADNDNLLVGHPEAAKEVLSDPAFLGRADIPFITFMKNAGGLEMGLAMSNGEYWDKHRRFANQTLLSPKIMNDFAPIVSRKADQLMKKWDGVMKSHGKVPINSDLQYYTLDSIGEMAFGVDFNNLSGTLHPLSKAIDEAFRGAQFYVFLPFPIWDYYVTPGIQKVKDALKVVRETGLQIIANKRKILESGKKEKNYVTTLLQARDTNGDPVPDTEINGVCVDIIMAGQDSTSATLAWTVYHMAKDPAIQQMVYDEVKSTFPSGPENATYDQLSRLPKTHNVFKETLRLYPPGHVFTRCTLKDTQISGYEVPKGTTIQVCPYALGRDQHRWNNVLDFNPNRFDDANGPAEPADPWSNVPFGAGPRKCIGMRVAILEAKMLLATILWRYKVSLPKDSEQPRIKTKWTMAPDRDISLELTPR